ncbi:hypothetical protein H8E88_15450 [candidate division KSB1 bacterium]|nr:hypothetical protein [candidate division KSB1 bacterium]MBL7093373.1 hypothetical protein [candidate division KSB1 bacterium]
MLVSDNEMGRLGDMGTWRRGDKEKTNLIFFSISPPLARSPPPHIWQSLELKA